jgi:hypothetical protein
MTPDMLWNTTLTAALGGLGGVNIQSFTASGTPENVPDWCADWPDFKDSDIIGLPYEGTTGGE